MAYSSRRGRLDLSRPVSNHPLNAGLVGWWLVLPHLYGGQRLWDLRNYAHGALTNGPTWQPGERSGGYGSLSFDGANDYVDCGAPAWSTTLVTIAFWVRPSNLATGQYISDSSQGGTISNVRACLQGFQSGKYNIFNNSAYPTGNATDTQMTASGNGLWDHVAWTSNGSTLQGYVNGNILVNVSANLTQAFIYGLRMGRPYTSASNSFNGRVDDYRVYSRALSAGEVAALYADARRGHPETLRWLPDRTWSLPEQQGGGTTHTQSLTGSLSLTPVLVKRDRKALSVALSLSAVLAKKGKKALTASLTLAGSLAKKAKAALSGALSLAGALAKRARKAISASLSLAGELTTRSFVLHTLSLSATLSLSGALTRKANKGLSASLSLSGALARRARKGLSAALSLAGGLAKKAAKALTAALSLAGLLSSEVSEAVDSTPPILDMSRDFTRTVSMSRDFVRTIDQAFDWVEE